MRKQQGADCQHSDKAKRRRWPGSTEQGRPTRYGLLSVSTQEQGGLSKGGNMAMPIEPSTN